MKEAPMNPESLAARLIEELKSDPVALAALRGILIPQELLGLPADVADMKQLLAQTVETQTKMAEVLAEMKDAQNQLIANQAKIMQRQDEFAETLKQAVNILGRVQGENLEFKLGFVLVTSFIQRMDMRKFKIMRSCFTPYRKVFLDKIYAAKDDGMLTLEQTRRILATDMIAVGKQISGKSDIWIAVEASCAIDENDIDRAKESADLLSLVYQTDSIPAAVGYDIPDQTRRYAEESDVEVILL